MADTLGAVNPLTYRGYVYDAETDLYYLESRYYDPAVERFINGDALTSTGQGIVGNNMFVYCGNNPAIRIDKSGHRYSNTEIHNLVLKDICDNHPTMTQKETYMKYKNKYLWHTYGYCDLYDTQSGEVWEVKRFMGGITCTKFAASQQLQNYVNNGILVYNPSLKLCTGGTYTTIDTTVFEVMDKDMSGSYVIAYWDAGDGIIFYDYVYVPSAEEIADIAIGSLILACYLGLAYLTSGASLGIPLPA